MVGPILEPAIKSWRNVRRNVADIVGMTSQLHQKADGLTVAARKRLELARALATTKPKIAFA